MKSLSLPTQSSIARRAWYASVYLAVGAILLSCMAQIQIPLPAKVAVPACEGTQPTTSFPAGFGTQDDPYVVCTTTQFGLIATQSNLLGSAFVLGDDLDLSSLTTPIGDYDAIAVSGTPFTGTLDGAGYTLRGFTISEVVADHPTGLFRYASGATFRDLILEDFHVTGTYEVGSLVGRAEGSTFDSIEVDSTVLATQSGRGYAGGLIGALFVDAATPATIEGIDSTGHIVGEARVGGVVGWVSISEGVFTVNDITGQDLTVTNSDSEVSALMGYGGVVGRIDQTGSASTSTFRNLSVTATSIRGSQSAAGLLGEVSQGGGSMSVSHSSFQGESSHVEGSSYPAYQVAGGLGRVRVMGSGVSFLAEHIAVDADVYGGDASGGGIGQLITSNGASSTLRDISFVGTVGYKPATRVSNSFGGLLGHVSMTGSGSSLLCERCTSNAAITAPGSWNGGLISTLASANATNTIVIRDSFATGTLHTTGLTYTQTGNGNFSGNANGGLVGVATSDVSLEITRSGANMAITLNSALANRDMHGGLVGYLAAVSGPVVFTDCYATGSITSVGTVTSVGGMFGHIQNGVTIVQAERSYADVVLTLAPGSARIGSFLGRGVGTGASGATSAYHNSDRAAAAVGNGHGVTGLAALTTNQLHAAANFIGWDFSTIWIIAEGVSAPTLR